MSLLTLVSLLLVAPAAPAPNDGAVLRRFALIASANDGGSGRARLRYADSDAVSVAEVLQRLGGLRAEDLKLVPGARRASLQAAFDPDARTPSAAPAACAASCSSTTPATPTRKGCCWGAIGSPTPSSAAGSSRRAPTCASPSSIPAPRAPSSGAGAIIHRPAVPQGPLDQCPRPRLPHRQLGRRGGPGVGAGRGRFLHPLPPLGAARRRRHQPRRAGHPERGLPVRLQRDPATHRADRGRRPAPRLRHTAGGDRATSW